jgi:uncharacterized membrane protein
MRSLSLLSVLSGLLVASAAGAAPVSPFEMHVSYGGVYYGTYDQTQLGCSAGAGETFGCQGTDFNMGDLTMNSWSFTLDADPVISGTTVVTNNTAGVQQFTLIFNLPVAAIPGATLIGGSIQGGVTDNTGDGATLSTVLGSSFYTALIDGAPVQTLYNHLSTATAGAFLSGNLPNLAFGTPIPSAPGPAVNTSIGIRLDFTLTPGDSASFTSNFVVVVPEPATALLMVMGLGVLAASRRQLR